MVNENVSEGKTKKELLANITYTQINMLMEDGDYETAFAIACELKMENIFYDTFFKNVYKTAPIPIFSLASSLFSIYQNDVS